MLLYDGTDGSVLDGPHVIDAVYRMVEQIKFLCLGNSKNMFGSNEFYGRNKNTSHTNREIGRNIAENWWEMREMDGKWTKWDENGRK